MSLLTSFPLYIIFPLLSSLPCSQKWFDAFTSTSCDIAAFYKGIDPDINTKVLTAYDNIEDAKLILVPINLDEGLYEVQVTRKGSNLYELEGTNIYVETRYCYEIVFYEDAIVKVNSRFGYAKGSIIFE